MLIIKPKYIRKRYIGGSIKPIIVNGAKQGTKRRSTDQLINRPTDHKRGKGIIYE